MSETVSSLLEFTEEVKQGWRKGELRRPVHLCGGNEKQLIEIFKTIEQEDWVLASHRNYYHALLKGVPRGYILDSFRGKHNGGSMSLNYRPAKFFSSAILGGCCPISIGISLGIVKRGVKGKVFCFLGDGATDEGIFWESLRYAQGWDLPVIFVVEDNNLSVETTVGERLRDSYWGEQVSKNLVVYKYKRTVPHVGDGSFVAF